MSILLNQPQGKKLRVMGAASATQRADGSVLASDPKDIISLLSAGFVPMEGAVIDTPIAGMADFHYKEQSYMLSTLSFGNIF